MWGALSRIFVKSDNIAEDDGNVLAQPSSQRVDVVEEAAEVEFVQSSTTPAVMEKNSQDMDTLESKQVRFLVSRFYNRST